MVLPPAGQPRRSTAQAIKQQGEESSGGKPKEGDVKQGHNFRFLSGAG